MPAPGYEIHLEEDYQSALERVGEALAAEGFGILTRIDVEAAFKEKLDKPFRPYAILGACNPSLAYRALSDTPEVGLLLPCNVTVESDPAGGSIVRIIDPQVMLGGAGLEETEALAEVASEAGKLLARVADALR